MSSNQLGDNYMFKCRSNYFKDIWPSTFGCFYTPDYTDLVSMGKSLIREFGIEYFSGYFQEAQYLVDLWTAHIILDNGGCSNEMLANCLKIIENYASGTINAKLSLEEKLWLTQYQKEQINKVGE